MQRSMTSVGVSVQKSHAHMH